MGGNWHEFLFGIVVFFCFFTVANFNVNLNILHENSLFLLMFLFYCLFLLANHNSNLHKMGATLPCSRNIFELWISVK